ncbi:MAG: ATP-binding protein [Nanoarchaeota archaeon]|nr:ATP-binding protein [Nanoarchaeota archaeon]
MRHIHDNELLNLDFRNSLVREMFTKDVILSQLKIPPIVISPDFEDKSFYPSSEKGLYSHSYQFGDGLRDQRFPRKILAGVHEAVRNAYQHGNHKDKTKKILLASKISEDSALFLIGDEGGVINQDFVPYILRFRQSTYPLITSFYKFSDKSRPYPENQGLGLSTMHLLFDDVQFFRGENGGLVTYLGLDAHK